MPDESDGYTVVDSLQSAMQGRRVWVPVDGEPRLGTVVRRTYAPKTGAELLAVELDEAVDGNSEVVVNPNVDDVLFENEL